MTLGVPQPLNIVFLTNLYSAKRGQMVGHKLAIKQLIAAHFQTRDQPCQGDF